MKQPPDLWQERYREAERYLRAMFFDDYTPEDVWEVAGAMPVTIDITLDDTDDVPLEQWLEEYERRGGARF